MRTQAQDLFAALLDWVGYDLGYSGEPAALVKDERRRRSEMEARLTSEIDALHKQIAQLSTQLAELKSASPAPTAPVDSAPAKTAATKDPGPTPVPAPLRIVSEGAGGGFQEADQKSSTTPPETPAPHLRHELDSGQQSQPAVSTARPERRSAPPSDAADAARAAMHGKTEGTRADADCANGLSAFPSESMSSRAQAFMQSTTRTLSVELPKVASLLQRLGGQGSETDETSRERTTTTEPSMARERLMQYLERDSVELTIEPGVPQQEDSNAPRRPE